MDPPFAFLAGIAVGFTMCSAGFWLATGRRPHGGAAYRMHDRGRRRASGWVRFPPLARDAIDRMRPASSPLPLIGWSPLRQAIGVGKVQLDDRMSIECISVELREAGGRILLRIHATGGGLQGPWLPGRAPIHPIVIVKDDVGTTYTATMRSWMGSDHDAELAIWFAPAPPETAQLLVVDAPRTPPFVHPLDPRREGAWTFTIPLTGIDASRPGIGQ